jgi:hypothetical protein
MIAKELWARVTEDREVEANGIKGHEEKFC